MSRRKLQPSDAQLTQTSQGGNMALSLLLLVVLFSLAVVLLHALFQQMPSIDA